MVARFLRALITLQSSPSVPSLVLMVLLLFDPFSILQNYFWSANSLAIQQPLDAARARRSATTTIRLFLLCETTLSKIPSLAGTFASGIAILTMLLTSFVCAAYRSLPLEQLPSAKHVWKLNPLATLFLEGGCTRTHLVLVIGCIRTIVVRFQYPLAAMAISTLI